MTKFCTNCDAEAVIKMTIKKPKSEARSIQLCATCKDAFEFGVNWAGQQYEENEI